jgi:hypothetical protein
MGAQTDVERLFADDRRNGRGHQMVRPPRGVFRRVVVEGAARHDFTYAERPVSHDRDGQLPSGNKALDQHLAAETPFRHLLTPRIVVDPHDAHADAGTLVGRLDDKGSRHRIALGEFLGALHHALYDPQAGIAEDRLCRRLVHRHGRGEDARMGVGDAEHLEHPLDRAVLPPDPVQCVEDDIGAWLERAQQCREITLDIDDPHLIAAVH